MKIEEEKTRSIKKGLFALTSDEDWGGSSSYMPGQEFQLPLRPLPYMFCGSETSVVLSVVVPFIPLKHTSNTHMLFFLNHVSLVS